MLVPRKLDAVNMVISADRVFSSYHIANVACWNEGGFEIIPFRLPITTVLTDNATAAVSDLFNLIFLVVHAGGTEQASKVKCTRTQGSCIGRQISWCGYYVIFRLC